MVITGALSLSLSLSLSLTTAVALSCCCCAQNQAWHGHPGTLIRTLPPAGLEELAASVEEQGLPPDTKCRAGQMP